jgi:hypothetical protein
MDRATTDLIDMIRAPSNEPGAPPYVIVESPTVSSACSRVVPALSTVVIAPFGEARGAAPMTWPDWKGSSAASRILTHVGARL